MQLSLDWYMVRYIFNGVGLIIITLYLHLRILNDVFVMASAPKYIEKEAYLGWIYL